MIDLDPAGDDPDPLSALMHLSTLDGEYGIAVRNDQTYLPRLNRTEIHKEPAPTIRIRADGSYLISGGLGGLGLVLARWLVLNGARRLVLLTRRQVPQRQAWSEIDSDSALGQQLAAVREIEALGAHIHLESCDVSDEQTLGSFLNRFSDEQWPAIRGVFHAAMVLENRTVANHDRATMQRIMRPKVNGALLLHHFLKGDGLDFFCMFSSAAALFGSPGQAGYAAANGFLDAFAHRCQAEGKAVYSIAWGPWKNTGWVARNTAHLALEKMGIEALEADLALECLAKRLTGGPAYVAVMPVHWSRFIQHQPPNAPLNFIAHLADIGHRSAEKEDHNPTKEIDRHRLLQLAEDQRRELIRQGIVHLASKIMQLDPTTIQIERPLNMQGLDSLMMVELKNAIQHWLGISIPMTEFINDASIARLSKFVAQHCAEETAPTATELLPDADNLHAAFPLNDIQQAYCLGRSDAFDLGGIGTHIYMEFDGHAIEPVRLNEAWQALIQRHDMLRCVVLSDSEQQILSKVPEYVILEIDLRDAAKEDIQHGLGLIRHEMSHQIFVVDRWPLFDIRATRLPDEHTRIHVSLDMMIADAASILILLDEWGKLYNDRSIPMPAIDISFRDYLLAEQRLESMPAFKQALAYWSDRLHSLPPGPELPLAASPKDVQNPHFSRHELRLESRIWSSLKNRAGQLGLTPSMLVCAVFAKTLARWSKTPHFTLNVTLFNRQPLHEQVNRLVGDFTSINLLEVNISADDDISNTAGKIQKQLWRDLEHRTFSGIRVLRELTRERSAQVTMPVVFTSNLENTSGLSWLGEVVYGVSKTPQVWLDHQVLEQDGELLCSWDYVDSLFPFELINDIFHSYHSFLRCLASTDEAWADRHLPQLSVSQLSLQRDSNKTAGSIPQQLLHEPFVRRATQQPELTALIAPGRSLTYSKLLNSASALTRTLVNKGVQRNELVAVAMEKGWEQTLSVIAILMAGAAYLPIDIHLPPERRNYLILVGQARVVLTQAGYINATWPVAVDVISIDDKLLHIERGHAIPVVEQSLDDLAYVIFTSGSTGLPKGVMIDHCGAVNTVLDINERLKLSEQDRVLALSNLNFDLSVYDIFGTLAAGAAIVVPDAQLERDPAHLASLVEQQRITIRNSVPALLSLYLDHLRVFRPPESLALRIAMLSGDWIPLSLPDEIHEYIPSIRILSLGGATEASIWSIMYPISRVEHDWKSIPYGKALRNQQMFVLNEALKPCPTWVPRQLYIGGIGLAKGYWGDTDKTAVNFIVHPHSGERLYRTGDLGRHLPDGNIEFLGREDFQVKIQGYRIELGEIEATLVQHPNVRSGIVLAVGERHAEKQLVGFVISLADPVPDTPMLTAFLSQKLPAYMVPGIFIALEAFPLSANGKIDRKALLERMTTQSKQALVAPRTPTEEALTALVQRTMNLEEVGVESNFFDMGFESLQGTTLVTAIRQGFNIDLPLRAFFEASTIAELATTIEGIILAEIDQLSNEEAELQLQQLNEEEMEISIGNLS
ncbi:MAG: amino acid adenylation domain-containing protein [Candidatus Thiodiazotropha sp. (ex Lucinoma aequizonata)]|nr:amino acid adenylation domain-containing protein [Candidatus Thiodiazotropha sp. (ex Lucinoma aequizonata)]MCU7896052.1 amino acid adenylation domain-containing protein [Candidatus Thiodiazotropha sp. (ex Lucinoma aequizonata)]MCU7899895.1 amino acid adenylation domain-containing protein [Candidatus Thiodiazotropha sp. (ex Lucinoma aequizonata)]MCU7908807.1 amino acid adenylation domain-containing protein [Candidatus Thiodiazotropha sp. (ex Lucinoma aequizonata)]MCU7912798.1 amino acid adeny